MSNRGLNKSELTIDPVKIDAIALHCREMDYERYLLMGFSPPKYRSKLLVALAFNTEISQISSKVSEPMLGNIRYQWWRDAINDSQKNKYSGHFILEPLIPLINEHSYIAEDLLKIINAYEIECIGQSPANIDELFSFALETGGLLNKLIAKMLVDCDQTAKIACSLGSIWTIINLMRDLPKEKKQAGFWIPENLLKTTGIDVSSILDIENRKVLCGIVEKILLQSEDCYLKPYSSRGLGKTEAKAALLIKGLILYQLNCFRKAGYDPYLLSRSRNSLTSLFIATMWSILKKY